MLSNMNKSFLGYLKSNFFGPSTVSTLFASRLFGKSTREEKLELFRRVEEVIERDVRPSLKADGGDIELHWIEDGCMVVTLEGACSTCSSSRGTLRHGVLGAVNDAIPEITDIRLKMDFEDIPDLDD